MKLEEIQSFHPSKTKQQYSGPTIYNVGTKKYQVAPWNHPSSLAMTIINWIHHTIFYGIYIVAPMGHGKTTIAQTIVHHLHLKDPRFRVVWAGAYEFTHQEQFFKSLPKKIPHVIVFDDISGALKQLTEKQIEANFATLTTVRDIIDPGVKRTPVVCIVVGHYSKNLEKEFRAQLGMSIYAAFGNEERTNLDSIAEKGSDARSTLEAFADLYGGMFENHKFRLFLGNGKAVWYETDNPFRCIAAISKTKGRIILYTDHDVCEKCVKKKLRRLVPAKLAYDKIFKAYGKAGIQALQGSLYRRGYPQAVPKDLAQASKFIDESVDPVFDYDPKEMLELIYAEKHKKIPGRAYTKHRVNNEILEDFAKNATVIEVPVSPLDNFQETSKEEPLSSNDQFLNHSSEESKTISTTEDNG